jgi:Dephospho-CoA kinase
MIIGITGKAHAGKDTAAAYFIERGYSQYSMAKPLKDMLAVIGVYCDTQEQKASIHPVFGVTNRHCAQTLGTEWMRNLIRRDGWVMLAHNAVLDLGPNVVIPDIRFDNEAEMVRKLGGYVVEIQRKDNPIPTMDHVSECGVHAALIDFCVGNNETIADLRAKLETIAYYMGDKP